MSAAADSTEPRVAVGRDVLYVPADGQWRDGGWGLFDRSGRGLEGAHAAAVGDEAPSLAVDQAGGEVMTGDFVYGGLLRRERSDFLLGALSRFWGEASRPVPGRRWVFHAGEPLDELLAEPTVGSVLAALGIAPFDCLVFDQPVRLARIVVPARSFEPPARAFAAFGRLCATIGIRLSGGVTRPVARSGAVHVSTARDLAPVLAQEDLFDRRMGEHGVAVVHPSAMSFAALVRRLRSAALVSTVTADGRPDMASLACLFGGGAVSRTVLVVAGEPSEDAVLLDGLCGRGARVVRASGRDQDAADLADEVCRTMRWQVVSGGLDGRMDGARQAGPEWVGCVDSDGRDASVLVGAGVAPGSPPWRVGGRQYPWVQVEFADTTTVRDVVLHGPAANEAGGWAFGLFGSFDGRDWLVLAEAEGDGALPRLAAGNVPWRARWLRLQSRTGAMALERVEIGGSTVGTGEG